MIIIIMVEFGLVGTQTFGILLWSIVMPNGSLANAPLKRRMSPSWLRLFMLIIMLVIEFLFGIICSLQVLLICLGLFWATLIALWICLKLMGVVSIGPLKWRLLGSVYWTRVLALSLRLGTGSLGATTGVILEFIKDWIVPSLTLLGSLLTRTLNAMF